MPVKQRKSSNGLGRISTIFDVAVSMPSLNNSLFLKNQNFETPFSEDYVAQTLFMSSIFMYISMAIVYSRGSPYRKPVWTNWIFLLALLILFGLSLGIVLGKADWIDVLFEFKYEYRTVNMTENDPTLHIPPLPKIDSKYPEVRLL